MGHDDIYIYWNRFIDEKKIHRRLLESLILPSPFEKSFKEIINHYCKKRTWKAIGEYIQSYFKN